MRLWLVVQALGFPDVSLGISGAFFVAFIGSLLTAVPLSPAGLGVGRARHGRGADAGLRRAHRRRRRRSCSWTGLISVFSIIVIGSIVYLVSPIRSGAGLAGVEAARRPADPASTRVGRDLPGGSIGPVLRPRGTGTGHPNGSRPHRTRPHQTARRRTRSGRASRTNG